MFQGWRTRKSALPPLPKEYWAPWPKWPQPRPELEPIFDQLKRTFEMMALQLLTAGSEELTPLTMRALISQGEQLLLVASEFWGEERYEKERLRYNVEDSARKVLARLEEAQARLKADEAIRAWQLTQARLTASGGKVAESPAPADGASAAGMAPLAAAEPPGTKPGQGTPKALACEIALEILTSPECPPRGRRRLTELARIVHRRLQAQGYTHQEPTVYRYIGGTVRQWEEKHPGK